MIETTLVSSPSVYTSQDQLGEFEKHTRGIGSKLLRKMGYYGQGIGKRIQGILSPILVVPMAKHEGLGLMEQVKIPSP
jgi:tuftelin-interacting protein 11